MSYKTRNTLNPLESTNGLTDTGKEAFRAIRKNEPRELTNYGRQEMDRMRMNLPPGLTPYAMNLPGIKPM